MVYENSMQCLKFVKNVLGIKMSRLLIFGSPRVGRVREGVLSYPVKIDTCTFVYAYSVYILYIKPTFHWTAIPL